MPQANNGSSCRRLRLWLASLALLIGWLFPAIAQADEVELCLRLAWGGANRSWSGTIELSEGTILSVNPLGLEADGPGSLQKTNRNTIRVLPRIPRTYDACDLFVRTLPTAHLRVRLAGENQQQRTIEIPIAKILQGLESHPLDDQGSRLLAQRAPGDVLRVEFDRPSLVFAPGEKFSFRLVPNFMQLPPNAAVTLQMQLTAGRGEQELQGFSRDMKADAQGEATPESLELNVPTQEGVYDIRLSLHNKRYTPSLIRARPLFERRVQIVVLAESEGTARTGGFTQIESEIDPATPKWWERMTRMPTLTNLNPYSAGPIGDRTPKIKSHLGHNLVELEPLAWQAYPLTTAHPGEPHILEIEYPSDLPQTLGISLVEPNSSGQVVGLGLDTGFTVSPPLPGHAAQLQRQRITIWPQTRSPVVLLVNRRDNLPAAYGKVRLLSGPSRLEALQLDDAAGDRRELTMYFDKPLVNEAFSADEGLDPVTKRNRDDWLTFLRGGRRLTEYLRHTGFSTAVIPALCEGSTIYPSDLLQPTPSYDNGAFFEIGQDPVRKDVLEMLFRQFDRAHLRLVPALHFATPLPALESIRGHEEQSAEGLEPIGADGKPVLTDLGSRRGQGPYYNPLDPRVQLAIEDIVREVAARYAHHPSFGGIALHLGPDSYLLVPGMNSCLDDETWERFSETQGLMPVTGPGRHAARAALLRDDLGDAWLQWRAKQLTAFYTRLKKVVQQRSPSAKLVLAGGDLLTDAVVQDVLRPALPASPLPPNPFLHLGLDLPSLCKQEGIVFPRPQRITPLADPAVAPLISHWNESPEVDNMFAGNSALVYHEPSPLRLPAFDEKSPFGSENTHTWFVPELTPAGFEARKRFAHNLAAIDPQEIIDGGWKPVFGQEDSLRPFVEVYRQLPQARFKTHSLPASQLPTTPVVVRSLNQSGKSWLYAVNDSPWAMAIELDLATDGSSSWQALQSQRDPNLQVTKVNGGLRIATVLEPYGILGGTVAGNATVTHWQSTPPPELQPWLRERIRETRLRVNSLRLPAPTVVLRNSGFEEETLAGTIPGWVFPRGPGITVAIDSQNPHEGRNSIKLTSQPGPNGKPPVIWMRSDPITPPRTGRLSLLAWIRVADPNQQPVLRLAVEGRVNGKAYYSRANVGAMENGIPARPLQSDWMPYRFPINDLPLNGLTDLRIGFDLMSAGEVWIDKVEVYDLWLEDHERDELLKNIASAELQLDGQKLLECERFLDSPWPLIVHDLVPLDGPRLMAVAEPGIGKAPAADGPRAAPEKDGPNGTNPPAENAEETESDRTGFFNRWKESMPKWPWR